MNCPHCKSALVPHEGGGAKKDAQHCYSCGCCFLADGKTPREGVPVCNLAQAPVEETVTAPAEPEPEEEAPPATAPHISRGRRT